MVRVEDYNIVINEFDSSTIIVRIFQPSHFSTIVIITFSSLT